MRNSIGYFLLFISVSVFTLGCGKKKSDFAIPTPPPVIVIPPPSVSITGLTISQSSNQATPNIDLEASIIYTTSSQSSKDFKPLPTGFDDKIKSFILPKGYMVVFAENQNGTGESICYVAGVSDLKENLPSRLVDKVSFVRFSPIINVNKKGICTTSYPTAQALNCSWFYNWGSGALTTDVLKYVPMTWGKGAANPNNASTFIGRRDIDHLLSFNEPDNSNQSNITSIDTAVDRYKIVLQTGLRMCSPAVEQDNSTAVTDWLPQFVNLANTNKARIDVIALHWYDWGNEKNDKATDQLNADAILSRFKSYVTKLHNAYPDKALWFTEYNCNGARNEEVQKIFMKASAEYLNTVPYVERYAYFFPGKYPMTSGAPDYVITDLGKVWFDIVSPSAFTSNIIPK